MVVGANGVGKSMIVNCLLEASCIPAEQYNTYVTAGPKSYKSTGYSFSEQQLPKVYTNTRIANDYDLTHL